MGNLLAIPTKSGNHTPEFTEAAASKESHQACINMSAALSMAGLRLLTDEAYFEKVLSDSPVRSRP